MKELLLKLVASDRKHLDGALLFLRLFIGGMMLSHGWAKLASFSPRKPPHRPMRWSWP